MSIVTILLIIFLAPFAALALFCLVVLGIAIWKYPTRRKNAKIAS